MKLKNGAFDKLILMGVMPILILIAPYLKESSTIFERKFNYRQFSGIKGDKTMDDEYTYTLNDEIFSPSFRFKLLVRINKLPKHF